MANNKNTKVPNVPNLRFPEFEGEWMESTIGKQFELYSGNTPSRLNKDYFKGEINWISSGELKDHYIYSSKEKISQEASLNLKLLPAGTFIIAIYGLEAEGVRGTGSIIKEQSTISQACMAFSSIGEVENEFLYSWYKKHGNIIGLKYAQGTKQQNLSYDILERFKIAYPSKQEQEKLYNFISLLDERIATQNKIIEKLQSLIKGLNDNIHKGIKGETVCFSDLGEAYSGLSGKGGDDFGYGEPFITYMNVYQNTYISEKDYELVQIAPNEKQNSVQYGDALFTLSSETPEEVGIGAVYLGNTQKLYLNSFCFGIHFYDERVLPQYLAHFISSSSFRRAIYPLAQGSTRFNLQKNDFMKMKFLLPSLEKQGHIANTLDALHCRLANEKSLTEQYILLKKYLLSLMLI